MSKENSFTLTPQKVKDSGEWSVVDWDNLTDTAIVGIVMDRLHNSMNHSKRVQKERVWKDNYKYYKGIYGEDGQIRNMSLFTIIEAKLAKMYRMMFHEEPFIRVFPDDPNTNTDKAEKLELLFHHQINENNPRLHFSRFLKQGMIYGANTLKVGWTEDREMNVKRNIIEGKSYLSQVESITGRPYFTVPDIFDVFPDMDAKTPDDITYVVEIQRRRLSQILNNRDIYTNIQELIGTIKSGKADKETSELVDKNFTSSPASESESSKPYGDSSDADDQYDPIVELAVYYEANRIVVVANGEVLLRNEKSPYWYKKIPFIFSQHYLDFDTVYGIGDIEPNQVLAEAEDIITNMLFDYSKTGLRRKVLMPETLSIDEEALVNTDNAVVYCENPDMVKELTLPNVNFNSGMALIGSYKDRQEEATAMTPYQKGAPARQETAAGVYTIQEAGNIRFLYNVDQYEPALIQLAIWFKELNYQFMNDAVKIEKRSNIGKEEWITLTPADLDGRFKYSFVGSANADNKDLAYNKLLQIYSMLVNRADIDQNYLLETLVKKSQIFDNPERLINSQGIEGVQRIEAQLGAGSAGGDGGSSPQGIPQGSPQEMSRLQRSEVNNPNNRFNGGRK